MIQTVAAQNERWKMYNALLCLIGIYLLSLSIFLLISDHPVPFLDTFSDPTFRTSASAALRNSHGFWAGTIKY
jgi:hypothetical protein